MARLEWVSKRLDKWGLWASARDSGGVGYPSAAAFTRIGSRSTAPQAGYLAADQEVNDTERAVQSLMTAHIDLWHTLQCYYVQRLDIRMTARRLRVGESTIKARFERADHKLSAWFHAQDEQRREAKARLAVQTPVQPLQVIGAPKRVKVPG